jgi:hypothetical protein
MLGAWLSASTLRHYRRVCGTTRTNISPVNSLQYFRKVLEGMTTSYVCSPFIADFLQALLLMSQTKVDLLASELDQGTGI